MTSKSTPEESPIGEVIAESLRRYKQSMDLIRTTDEIMSRSTLSGGDPMNRSPAAADTSEA